MASRFLVGMFSLVFMAMLCAESSALSPTCVELGRVLARLGPTTLIEETKLSEVKTLSTNGVYRVPLVNGGLGVLRVDYADPYDAPNSSLHDTDFERFSAGVFNRFGKPLPIARPILVSDRLKNRIRQLDGRVVKKATLLPLYPGEQGSDFLDARVGLSFRSSALALLFHQKYSPRIGGRVSSVFRSDMKSLRNLWLKVTASARRSIVQDFQALFPGVRVSESSFLDQLEAKLVGRYPASLESFVDQALDHLPVILQNELAEAWAIGAILAIPDFHPGNWLVHEGQLVPIDLAYRSAHFTEARPDLLFSRQQNPLNGLKLTHSLVHKFIERLSPEFIDKLRTLTDQDIRSAASDSKFRVNKAQVKAVLLRAQSIVDFERDSTEPK